MPLLSRRDLAASILTALLVTIYLAFLATSNFLRSNGMACVTLLLSGSIIIVLAGRLAPDLTGWLTAVLAIATFGTASAALATRPSALLLTIAIGTTVALWSVQLAQHITFPPPHDEHEPNETSRRSHDFAARSSDDVGAL